MYDTIVFNIPLFHLLTISRQGISILTVILAGLFFLSFIAGGARLALFSLKQKDINYLKLKTDENARRIIRLLEHPRLILYTITTAQIMLNTGIIIIANYMMDALLDFRHPIPMLEIAVKILLITFVILMTTDLIPKIWAHHHTVSFLYFSSWWMETIIVPFAKFPAVKMLDIINKIETKRIKKMLGTSSDEELSNAIDRMTEEEASPEEKQILKGIQSFSSTIVRQIMHSRLDIQGIESNSSLQHVIEQIKEQNYSRYPVYTGNMDTIIGILQTKDLLPYIDREDHYNWKELMRPPYFVPEQKSIEDLLKEFQQQHKHMAIVVDEFGGTSGIVTMEDVLEEIIGDIKDEFDEDEFANRKLDEFNYLLEGKTMIHDVCKIMNLPADTFDGVRGESESLAGLILEIAERLPKVNDMIESGDFSFTILEVRQNRIEKVKITIKPFQD